MNDIKKLLHDLSSAGKDEPCRPLDVRRRVRDSIASLGGVPGTDVMLLVMSAGGVVAAAAAAVMAIPMIEALFEPWLVYLLM